MFRKFGQDLPQSLVDAVSGIMEAGLPEPAKPDPEAIARRKKLQALKDKAEDEKAEKGESKPKSNVRVHKGSYGTEYKGDMEEELKGNQHKIDANKNGKIDAHDFKLLRGKKKANEEVEEIDEVVRVKDTKGNYNLTKGAGKAAAVDRNDAAAIVKHHKNVSKSIGTSTKQFMQGSKLKKATGFEVTKEEVEQIDELSVQTMRSAEQKLKHRADDERMDDNKAGMRYYLGRAVKVGAKAGAKERAERNAMKNEEIDERELTPGEAEKKEKYVKSMKKGLAGFKARYGQRGKSVMYATATKMAKEETELEEELVLDLTEGATQEKKSDLPFEPDAKKGKVAVAGKKGYGVSASRHLARMGLKKMMDKTKNETMMGKAGCTSEETEIEESRGHKIIATKLAQIDRMSSGIAPDHSTNNQSTKDKIKDVVNVKKAEIVTQKDTSMHDAARENEADELEAKHKLNKMSHGYGNVQHNEEVELDETATLDKYIKSMGYDPLHMEKNKKVMFSKTNAFKSWAQRQEDLYDGGQKGTQDIDTHVSPGATARG